MADEEQEKASYDLEQVYDEQISPLMKQIIEICKEHDLPVVASFAYAYNADEGDKKLCTTNINMGSTRYPDEFHKICTILKGGADFAAFTITSGPMKQP